MPKGIAHPYFLIALTAVVCAGIAVYSGSKHIAGIVLGSRTISTSSNQYKENGVKISVVSPNASWDLTEYLCNTKEECEKSMTSGKWWATVSGVATTKEGHEVFVEKSVDWEHYTHLKIVVKTIESNSTYLKVKGDGNDYAVVELDKMNDSTMSVVFM